MPLSTFFFQLFRFFLPPVLICTVYLYSFPFLKDCGFPPAKPAETACYFGDAPRPGVAAELAPFRLLAIGDPQLEGDTSLPDPDEPFFPSLVHFWDDVHNQGLGALPARITEASKALLLEDIPRNFQACRKRVDLWGNDLYLAHVYGWIKWYSDPTHVVVLGDLLGSQWIHDQEFQKRSHRFWNTVFKGAQQIPKEITQTSSRRPESLGEDRRWEDRIIAVAGNHDIGYAGDVTFDRVERFEKEFGSVNWAVTFRLNHSDTPQLGGLGFPDTSPALRLIILNSMNLDGPARDEALQRESQNFFMEEVSNRHNLPRNTASVLLTHIPLHKQEGTCVDAPFFSYWPADEGGGLREQNHLSESVSDIILNGLVGQKRRHQAIILNGHDHEGCHVYHWRNKTDDTNSASTERAWKAKRYFRAKGERNDESAVGVREITVRSIMGNFDGNVGFLSAWWDSTAEQWRFEYNACMFGVQHIWWAIYVLDIIVAVFGVAGLAFLYAERPHTPTCKKAKTA